MSRRAAVVLALSATAVVALGACGPSHSSSGTHDAGPSSDGAVVDGAPLPHTLESLVITPANQIVQLDLNATGTQAFTVMATYEDGTSDDVTAQATFAAANAAVGTFTGPTLAIPAFTASNAITSPITATLSGMTANAQITVVAYRQTGPQQDFFFILPYQDPNGPVMKPLAFSTAVPALDVFFLMDTTGSMAGEISNLQSALTGTVIPGIKSAVANSEFGVGSLEDFPIEPYGVPNSKSDCGQGLAEPDQPLRVFQTMTTDTGLLSTAVSELSTGSKPIGCGDDLPEGCEEAIYQVATGTGLTTPSPTNIPANTVGKGGAGFRTTSMPVIVAISDAGTHDPITTDVCTVDTPDGVFTVANAYAGAVQTVAHNRQQTKDAVAALCGRVVGISAIPSDGNTYSQSCTATSWMTDLATASGARVPPVAWSAGTRPAGCSATQCCTGQNGAGQSPDANGLCPMVFDVTTTGTGVSTGVVTGIQMLAQFATFDVDSAREGSNADINGVALPTPHTTADFLKSITPTSAVVPTTPAGLPVPTFDTTTFHTVTPGTTVSFAIDAFNDFVMQTDQAQIFRATIQVLAGGCTALDQRDVLILVPPAPVTIN